jgi:hypothetical protein
MTFCPSFLVSFSFHQLDLLAAASTSKVVVVLVYPSSRRRLVRGEALSSSADDVPYYRWNRQNRIVQFAKPEGLIFPISNRSFRLLSDSCANRRQF